MAKFYVASSFDNKAQVAAIIKELQAQGHVVTHDWTQFEQAYFDHPAEHAKLDMAGVVACTYFVGLFDKPLRPLNTYAELGMALALKKQVCIIGNFDEYCIFSRLPQVQRYADVAGFLHMAGRL